MPKGSHKEKKARPVRSAKAKTPAKNPGTSKVNSKKSIKNKTPSSSSLPTKWMREFKTQDSIAELAARAQEIEKAGIGQLNSANLEKLNYDELIEVYQTFADIDEEEPKKVVLSSLQAIPRPSVEKATLGHRIWSYFYEKVPIRLFILFWFFLAIKLKTLISYRLLIVDPDSLQQIPPPLVNFLPPLVNFLFLEDKSITLGIIIALILLLTVWISWRIWIAWLESNANFIHPGSTYFRQHLGLIVVNKKGKPLNPIFAFLRGLFRIFPLSLISVLSMEFSKSGRGIHDLLFGTYVLRIYKDLGQEEIAHFIQENF